MANTDEPVNFLDLPDDELEEAYLNMDQETSEEEVSNEDEEDTETTDSDEAVDDDSDSADADESDSSDEDADSDSEEDSSDAEESEEEVTAEESKDSEETTSKVDSSDTIDYKSQYEALLQPFKANGREITIDNIDDARRLMQMGANYNKKMGALKPNLKIVKMLDNHGLLDESKLSYLIDLDKKNPEAIKQLIKESGLDPLEFDGDAEVKYQPNTYTASDSEVDLDGILDEIRDTDSYTKTLDIVGNKWDDFSREVIGNDPSILRVINDHVSNGIYDQVANVMEKERMLGRLNGLSDIEAYKQIGDRINAEGGFGNQSQPKTQPASKSASTNTVKKANTVDQAMRDRKKSAGSTKGKVTKPVEDFNPLNMSDEEFEKMAHKFV